MFLSKLFTFFGGSRAPFSHPHFCDTWRRGFRPQKCVKSEKSEAFPGESGLAVGASLRCFVFPYLEVNCGIFLGKMKPKSVSAPLLVVSSSPVLCFSAFGTFLSKMRFSIGVCCGGRIRLRSFSGNTARFSAMLTCLHFQALFLGISGPPKISIIYRGPFWML